MSRNSNLELQQKLQCVLHRMLFEKGYDATSYQAVADSVGISRTIVQYYYPQKIDFAIGFLEKLLEITAQAMGLKERSDDEGMMPIEVYYLACVYHGFLLSENGAHKFVADIIKDRELTNVMMPLHCKWVMNLVDPGNLSYEPNSPELIIACGGLYELMYYSIKNDIAYDIALRLIPVLQTIFDFEDCDETCIKKANELIHDLTLMKKIKTMMDL